MLNVDLGMEFAAAVDENKKNALFASLTFNTFSYDRCMLNPSVDTLNEVSEIVYVNRPLSSLLERNALATRYR